MTDVTASVLDATNWTIEQPTLALRMYAPDRHHPPRVQQAWQITSNGGVRVEWRDLPVVIGGDA